MSLPPNLCFESLCVLAYEMELDTAYRWVLTFYSIFLSVSLIGAFNAFKFKVNTVMCAFDPAILMLPGCFVR